MLKKHSTWIMLLQIPLAWEWLSAGWEKIMMGGLGAKFAANLPRTLEFFTKQVGPTGTVTNPHTWYVNSFLAWGQSNPTLFGYGVAYGELAIGLVIVAAIGYSLFAHQRLPKAFVWLVVAALIVGIFLNYNFYFAAAWPASASATRSVNIMMGLLQLILIGYYLSEESKKEEA